VKKKLHKDKIVLVGHSWGSVLGFLMVTAHPELFSAFVGTGQVAAEFARSSALPSEDFGSDERIKKVSSTDSSCHRRRIVFSWPGNDSGLAATAIPRTESGLTVSSKLSIPAIFAG
jgi:pimeloyl-ACP methyl ester carboxylesterase